MTFRNLFITVTYLLAMGNLSAQVLDEETGFIYVKAEYLFETGRYEDAIKQYNLVITRDPKYKDAIIHRGMAKYGLAGYKGSKIDALLSIEMVGISGASAALLGRSFAAMNDVKAAVNSLSAAIALDDKNTDYLEWRAELYEKDSQLMKACQDYELAMNLGSISAEMKAKSLCGVSKTKHHPTKSLPSKQTEDDHVDSHTPGNPSSEQTGQNNKPTDISENEVLSSGTKEDDKNGGLNNPPRDSVVLDDSEPKIVDDGLPKEDDYVNSFVIDDDLTIELSGQELGRRKIKEIPSILILADENGKVTVNICVNKAGVVTKAEFNASMSSIAKKRHVIRHIRRLSVDSASIVFFCRVIQSNFQFLPERATY